MSLSVMVTGWKSRHSMSSGRVLKDSSWMRILSISAGFMELTQHHKTLSTLITPSLTPEWMWPTYFITAGLLDEGRISTTWYCFPHLLVCVTLCLNICLPFFHPHRRLDHVHTQTHRRCLTHQHPVDEVESQLFSKLCEQFVYSSSCCAP